jgi:hypothetical protein
MMALVYKFMKSLLFIESPLQLLNAFEAIEKFQLKDYSTIIRLSNIEKNDKQMKFLVDKLDIKNVLYITINIKNRTIIDYMKIFFYRVKYIFAKLDQIFIGNYDSGFLQFIMKQFNQNNIVLLDDGAKSIDIQKKFTEQSNYNLFTMYNFKPFNSQILYKNNYRALKMKLNDLIIDADTIMFLGLKLCEIGIITEDYYIEKIKQIAYLYSDYKILYISHREEKKSKLEKIRNISNIIVKELDYPIELYGLYEDVIPYKVASFYSTALYTMKNIYNIEAESFVFDYSQSEYKDLIDNVYNYYNKYILVKDIAK